MSGKLFEVLLHTALCCASQLHVIYHLST